MKTYWHGLVTPDGHDDDYDDNMLMYSEQITNVK